MGLHDFMLLRKSRRPEELADPDILRKHRATLTRLAEDDGVEIPAENIVEEVISGEHLAARSDFTRLVERWERLPPRTGGRIYCMDADRLSRGSRQERGRIYDAISGAGLLLRTPAGLLNAADAAEGLLLEVKGALARHELLQFKQRLAAGRAVLVREGKIRCGRVPFGYRWDRNLRAVVTHPEEFPVLQRLCQDALTQSCAKLGERYASHGLYYQRVLLTLRNPVICGWAPHRYHDSGSYAAPREQWIWPEQPGDWEPAISREEWEHLQEVLDSRRCARVKPGSSRGWCRDVIRFEGVEGPIQLGTVCNWQDRAPVYQYRPDRNIARHYVKRALVHDFAAAAVRLAFSRPREVLAAMEEWRHLLARQQHSAADPDAIRRQIVGLRDELRDLGEKELVERDEERKAVWMDLSRRKSATIKVLKQQIDQAHQRPTVVPRMSHLAPVLEAAADRWEEFWEERLTDDDRRLYVNTVLASLTVRIITGHSNRSWRREIVAVEYQPWVPADLRLTVTE